MRNKVNAIVTWVLAALSPAICAIVYGKLPDEIPVHWDINGTVSYGNKSTLIMMAVLPLALALMFQLLPKIDPRKKNYSKFGKYYDYFCIFMMVFMLIMNLVIISESFHPGNLSVSLVVQLMVGVLFIFLGNMMPKFKSNFFVGIKTPWTLSSTDVWNKTHRLGGILMFASGVIIVITSFFLPDNISFWLLMGLVMISALIPFIMSYIWFRKLGPGHQADSKGDENQ